MHMRYGSLGRSLCFVLAAAIIPSFQSAPARAQTASAGTDAVRKSSSPHSSAHEAPGRSWSTAEEPYIGAGAPQWRYFVEFRARNAASYGHMYVMFGKVNAHHEVVKSEIAGLFPAGDTRGCENCSIYYWSIGHVLPVPSEIGASDGDLEEQYVLARFRVWIDAAQYKRLVAYINQRKANRGPWNAFLNNCVTFGRDVAVFLNLKVPVLMSVAPSVVMYPKEVVHGLAEANGVYKDQGALKDAPSSLMIEASPKVSERAAGAKAASSSLKKHLA